MSGALDAAEVGALLPTRLAGRRPAVGAPGGVAIPYRGPTAGAAGGWIRQAVPRRQPMRRWLLVEDERRSSRSTGFVPPWQCWT